MEEVVLKISPIMKRKKMFDLNFTTENKDKYDLIYEVLLGSGQRSLEEDALTFIDVLRKFRKLGSLSTDADIKRSKLPLYVFDQSKAIDGQNKVTLSKAELTLLKSILGKTKFQPWFLELGQETKEWLDGITESDNTETK